LKIWQENLKKEIQNAKENVNLKGEFGLENDKILEDEQKNFVVKLPKQKKEKLAKSHLKKKKKKRKSTKAVELDNTLNNL